MTLLLIGMQPPAPRKFHGTLKDLLPKVEDMPGWQVQFQPIADTPEMKAKVGELLNYDDAVFAIYTRGAERFSIYIAYWTPGKMSHRLVAGHTPDVCWVGAGWLCDEAVSGYQFSTQDGISMPPAEFRKMHLDGATEYVAFWHFLDGKTSSYNTVGTPPWYASLADLFAYRFKQKPEQLFVRISSPSSPAQWPSPAAWQRVVLAASS